MSREILLAADLIGRLLGPAFGEAGGEEAALRLGQLAQRLTAEDERRHPMPSLGQRLEDLNVLDLPDTGWIWLLERAMPEDPELPSSLLDELYASFEDGVLRLRMIDAVMSHPRLVARYAGAVSLLLEGRITPLDELPHSWARDHARRLVHGAKPVDGQALWMEMDVPQAVQEIAFYLLQAGTKPALVVLAALLTEKSDVVEPARHNVDLVLEGLEEAGIALRRLLGLIGRPPD